MVVKIKIKVQLVVELRPFGEQVLNRVIDRRNGSDEVFVRIEFWKRYEPIRCFLM